MQDKPTGHDVTEALLLAYVDGELGASERQRVESILANDPHARDQTDTAPPWVRQVINYQLLYHRATVAGTEPTPTEQEVLTAELSGWLGKPITIPDLSAQALTFKRGQPLALADRPLVQLVYLPAAAGRDPIALCVTTAAANAEQKPVELIAESSGGMYFVRWRNRGLDYVLIGKQSPAALEQAARAARAQLAGRA